MTVNRTKMTLPQAVTALVEEAMSVLCLHKALAAAFRTPREALRVHEGGQGGTSLLPVGQGGVLLRWRRELC